MSNAPVCNINGAVPVPKPKAPGLSAIAPATDLQSVIRSVNQLTNNFSLLLSGSFIEDRALRRTVVTRVFNPQDSSQWVDVRQIVSLTFVSPYGQTIFWQQ